MQKYIKLFIILSTFYILQGKYYLSLKWGINTYSKLKTEFSDNDVPTQYDGYLIDDDPEPFNSSGDKAENEFDFGTNLLDHNTALGYKKNAYRFEFAWNNENVGGENSATWVSTNDKDSEFIFQRETLSNFNVQSFMFNFYYDLELQSKFIPYFGVGMGLARVEIDYHAAFVRNSNKNIFINNNKPEDAAGTASIGTSNISELVFGYNLIFGVDYKFKEDILIGLRFSFNSFGGVSSDKKTYDVLRSHESRTDEAPNGEIVKFQIETDDIVSTTMALEVKYYL